MILVLIGKGTVYGGVPTSESSAKGIETLYIIYKYISD